MGGTIPMSTFAGAVAGAVAGSAFGPAGTLLGGAIGFVAGNKLGWLEGGPAGRTYSNATNIDVTGQSGFRPFRTAHQNLPSSSVWSKIDRIINQK